MIRQSHLSRRSAGTVAAVFAVGVTLLTGCSSNGSSDAGSSPSAATASEGGAATPGSASASASASGTHSGGGTQSGGGTKSGGGAANGSTGGCRSLIASAAVKDAVTGAYANQSNPHRGHIQPQAGTFYYGECGTSTYAAAVFEPTADASDEEKVAAQDEGSMRQYFERSVDNRWTLIAMDKNPNSGCAEQIPAALASLWGHCSK
ncbi:hypothetical protein ABZ864_25420 [Streptomyces sp. NPDC047082]|uniref:hypothetical protein n=1 Tax=Streptomyces sp. NPDC047082 TaxID=3155259 RepID=UPI0033C439A5